jgi:alpha-glucoside transport system substrate-binding protein
VNVLLVTVCTVKGTAMAPGIGSAAQLIGGLTVAEVVFDANKPERSLTVREISSRTWAMRMAATAGVVVALVAVAAGCGGSSTSSGTTTTTSASSTSGTVTFFGVWTGVEQTIFQKVIAAFNKQYPKVKVDYKPEGANLNTVLATRITAGNPPDIADIAQPGYMSQLASQGHLKPIQYAVPVISQNFAPVWLKLGSVSGVPYALVYKASNKSTLWYNVPVFKQAGASAPRTWSQLLSSAKTIKASGTPAWSICGASGWTLTDLFENIYLRLYGPGQYNQLTQHYTKWTDSTVTTAMQDMAKIIGDSSNIAGGTSGALKTNYPACVDKAFASPPDAAMVPEADFVGSEILASTKAQPVTGFNAVPFPTINSGSGSTAVEIGGDLLVTFHDTLAIEAFMKYLATPEAAIIWARHGGFGTGNNKVPASVYPDAVTRAVETPIGSAESVVFDMSDEQPTAFGSTAGQGEWGLFQKFLQHPTQIHQIQQQLESEATAAYKGGK